MAAALETFREACCHKLGIPATTFEERVLWECLPPHHLWLGKLRWRFTPSYFNPDLELIRAVADYTNLGELVTELDFYRYHHPEVGFQRKFLHARLSGQRLVNFAGKFLPPN